MKSPKTVKADKNKTDKTRLESHLTAISLKKTDENPIGNTGIQSFGNN